MAMLAGLSLLQVGGVNISHVTYKPYMAVLLGSTALLTILKLMFVVPPEFSCTCVKGLSGGKGIY